MTGNAIVITAVFFAFLVAVAISIFITYRKTNRVLKDNDHLANVVENLKEESEVHQKTLDELKEQLRTKDHVLKLQVETESLRENIKDTKDMTDDELRAWIELQMMESRMFCDDGSEIGSDAEEDQTAAQRQYEIRPSLRLSDGEARSLRQ